MVLNQSSSIATRQTYAPYGLALLAGICFPLSLAPYGIWPLSLVGLVLFQLALQHAGPRKAMLLGGLCGLGLYGIGVSWVFVAISQFGNSSLGVAVVLTALFVGGLALVFALPFCLYGYWLNRNPWAQTLGFSALWVLSEWLKTWLFTGFPWLFVGYAFIDTPLSGLAPLGGVLSVSLAACLTANVITLTWCNWRQQKPVNHLALGLVGAIWLMSGAIKPLSWTEIGTEPIQVGLVQPNIPQDQKWNPDYYSQSLAALRKHSAALWELDWVIWPEAAVPYPYHQAAPLLEQIDAFAKSENTAFITGIIYDDLQTGLYYNALIASGEGKGYYFKQRLVPFGEYVPFEAELRGLIAFFNLPTSIISLGPYQPDGLIAKGTPVAASICYEIVYPDLIATLTRDKAVLLTVSNDGWFGDSIGPLQHFDMARFRALETGRYLIRATNTGVSGLIDPQGRVLQTGPRQQAASLQGTVYPVTGQTPFMVWRSWPLVVLALLLLLSSALIQKRTPKTIPAQSLQDH